MTLSEQYYSELLKRNLVVSKSEFCRDWLRKSAVSYMSCHPNLTTASLAVLLVRLWERGLDDLAERCYRDLRKRALAAKRQPDEPQEVA